VQRLLSIFLVVALALIGISTFPTQPVAAAGDFFFPENFNTMQDAIDAAEAAGGGTVHASNGIYTEKISLKSGVRVIADNIGGVIIDAADTGTVVTAIGVDNTAEINGIIITGGNSIDGAGMYIENSSPIIANCEFINNTASNRGGGIYNNSNSSPLITNCTFLNNSAKNGGGMYNYGNSSPVVTECTFSGNSATAENGGGIINDNGCSPIITDCTFAENTAYFLGGGMYNLWNCSPVVTGCAFIDNEAEYGGGMANRDYCNPVLSSCNFAGNEAKLRDDILWGFGGVGGGVYNSQASPIVANCIFSGNSAEVHGGGIYGRDRSKPQITNCTFVSNISLLAGSTLAFDSDRQSRPNTVQISNCIIWDGGNGIWNNDNSSITISYSDVQGSGGSSSWTITSATDGGGNIDEDPLLDNNLYLQAGSPCIDAGDNTKVPAGIVTDFQGNDRFFDDLSTIDTGNGMPPIVDIGIDEFGLGPVINVNTGYSYRTIQLAIDTASSGDAINVTEGTYYENISWNNKDLVIIGEGEGITIIDGSGSGSVITTNGLTNAARLEEFTLQNGISWRGGGMWNQSYSSPTITNCTFLNNSADNGGGMYNYRHSSPVVTECTFSGNSATAENGGGIINDYICSPTIIDCTFTENTAHFLGGGMYNLWNCSPMVTGCAFIDNEAEYGGGMANRDYCNPVLTNCSFTGNEAVLRPTQLWGFGGVGGGVYNSQASPTMTNCIFSGNSAEVHGSGLYGRDRSKPQITNCTFVSNIPLLAGSTLAFDSVGQSRPNTVQISNCIIWDGGNGIWNNDNSIITISYSDVQGSGGSSSWTITSAIDVGGNIDEDPLLDDNLCLQAGSPCIDAGSNDALPADTTDLDGNGNTNEKIPFDIDGNPRIVGDVVDIGALESQPPPNEPPVADAGGPYLIDMGDDLYLDGTGSSDPDTAHGDSIVSYEWDLNDDGEYNDATGETTVVIFNDYGVYTVGLKVTDSLGECDTDTAIVEVLAVPEVMVETLGEDLDAIGLPEGMENSLTKSLDSALKVLEDSNEKNDVAAINALEAFINKIEAQRGKKITVEVADDLITKALEIITALSEDT